jgi:hypothetical protein
MVRTREHNLSKVT